jgi:hypothetical protein
MALTAIAFEWRDRLFHHLWQTKSGQAADERSWRMAA